MALTNLSQVIGQIQTQEGWQQRRQFLLILEHWSRIVGESVAMQTRPTGIYRQVLQVAVSNSSWSQALTFERQRILKKLHPFLAGYPETVKDIHFSTAKWFSTKEERSPVPVDPSEFIKQHPSYISVKIDLAPLSRSKADQPKEPLDALTAFNRWANLVKSSTSSLPKCSRCQCPTPKGEITRWGMCRNCYSQNCNQDFRLSR